MKEQLRKQRLLEYEAKMFHCEMDIVAFVAIGDTENAGKYRKALEDLKTAYKAIEGMPL